MGSSMVDLVAAHGGRSIGPLGGASGGSGWPRKWPKITVEAGRKNHTTRHASARPNRGERFEALASPIKTKHELGFMADIASFQLA